MLDNLCDKCGERPGFHCRCPVSDDRCELCASKPTPLEEAEKKITKLKDALIILLGIEHTEEGLSQFQSAVRLTGSSEEEKKFAMEAGDVLRELL